MPKDTIGIQEQHYAGNGLSVNVYIPPNHEGQNWNENLDCELVVYELKEAIKHLQAGNGFVATQNAAYAFARLARFHR